MKIVFASVGWEDYVYWVNEDRKVLKRLNTLIEACRRDPFSGIGKPEPLKGELRGWWSRRLTDEHRLVYRVHGSPPDQALEILQCRSHY